MTDKATPFTEPGVYSWHDQLKQQTMTNIFPRSKPEKICRVVSSSLPFPDSLLCHLPTVAGFVVGLKENLLNTKNLNRELIGKEMQMMRLIWFKMSWWQHWLCFLFFTHEIKVMFCMKILGVVSDEVLNVFHSCFAVANQRLEFFLKFRNLEVLSSGSDWNSEIIFWYQISDEIGLKGIWTKPTAPQRICKKRIFVWPLFKAFDLTFCCCFGKNKSFMAVWTLHCRKICPKLCDITAPRTPATPGEYFGFIKFSQPALEIPFLLDALLPLQ